MCNVSLTCIISVAYEYFIARNMKRSIGPARYLITTAWGFVFCFLFLFFFKWLHPQHMEVPGPRDWNWAAAGTYTTAVATPDPQSGLCWAGLWNQPALPTNLSCCGPIIKPLHHSGNSDLITTLIPATQSQVSDYRVFYHRSFGKNLAFKGKLPCNVLSPNKAIMICILLCVYMYMCICVCVIYCRWKH